MVVPQCYGRGLSKTPSNVGYLVFVSGPRGAIHFLIVGVPIGKYCSGQQTCKNVCFEEALGRVMVVRDEDK